MTGDVRLIWRPIDRWPRAQTVNREYSQFKRREHDSYRRQEIPWSETRSDLERELRQIGVREAQVQLALTERDIRIDGEIRANAKLLHPGVVLSFVHPKVGPVLFACDRWTTWQANIRGIAKGLEALRLVERYGITQSFEQYTGWKAIGAGVPMPAAQMTADEAARFIADHADASDQPGLADRILADPAKYLDYAYRRAAKALHPDVGGDEVKFKRLQEAKALLDQFRTDP
jgi:hypothetical protein